jgi:lysophospholipase L1-like esterase
LLGGITSLVFATSVKAQTPAVPLKIAIIGDSTVSDYSANDPHRGWGQALPDFFNPGVSILNLAKTGASTKTFPPDRWQKVLEDKPDFLLIQFGHNDEHPKSNPEATDAATDYKDNLRRYVKESRQVGATPIFVTSMHRRTFDKTAQHLTTELAPYVNAMKEVGQELSVPVVDLYEKSGALFESLGEQGSTPLTLNNTDHADRPGKGDRTHFTAQGAHEMARLVVEDLVGIDPRLKAALKPANP